MNIFCLHPDPEVSAQMMNDKHIVKMPLESVQMLCTVHHIYGSPYCDTLYRPTHAKHPSTVWTALSQDNYRWLWRHAKALNDEYKYRFDSDVDHLSWYKHGKVLEHPPEGMPETADFGLPTPAMPDYCKQYDDTGLVDSVESYRYYYINEKQHLAKWTKRDVPDWYELIA
jgi:hypothetical protein